MKIYIANHGIHMNSNLQILEQDGYELINLTEGSINIFDTDRLKFNIKEKLKETNVSDRDYLLLSGSPVINGIASVLMFTMTKKLNYYIYGAKDKDYVKRDQIFSIEDEKGIGQ